MSGFSIKLFREFLRDAPLLADGFIHEIYRQCGKPHCSCASGRQENLHGPYLQYCFYDGPKMKTVLISPGQAEELERAIERFQSLKEQLREAMVVRRDAMVDEIRRQR